MDNLILFIILALIYGVATLFKRLGQGGQEQRGEETPEEPARPAPGGLEDIRRFLEEITGGPGEGVPPTRRTPMTPGPQVPSAPTPRPAGRPPTRRRAPAGVPSTAAPPPRPTHAPGVVTAQSVAAAATPVRLLAGRLSEAKVKETLRAGEVSTKAETLARQAERLAATAPRKLVTVAPAGQAEAYRTGPRAPAPGLLEAVQRLQQPLARAILYQEIIGLPLAIRGPERTFTDRVP